MNDPVVERFELRQLAQARDEARAALGRIAGHITDRGDTSEEAHRYRGALGWPSGSLDADIHDVERYFVELGQRCRFTDHPAHHVRDEHGDS